MKEEMSPKNNNKMSLFGDEFLDQKSKKKKSAKPQKKKIKPKPKSSKTKFSSSPKKDNQQPEEKKRGGGFIMATDLVNRFSLEDKGGYITQEFQDFGYRMAVELDDMPHKSLYIKMAKTESRGVLESILAFVKDSNARNKARLFMWKLKQVRLERVAKKKDKI